MLFLYLLLVCSFAAIFYALHLNRYVRASLRGPGSFSVEFEAHDGKRDPEKEEQG